MSILIKVYISICIYSDCIFKFFVYLSFLNSVLFFIFFKFRVLYEKIRNGYKIYLLSR